MYLEDILAQITPLDQQTMLAARTRQGALTKPQGSLGRLEELSIQMAGITGSPRPRLRHKVVLVMAGGGSGAISSLLEVPGASRTLLEAVVPYHEGAFIHWLGGRPDHFCAPPTARAMAMVAFRRAATYDASGNPLAGVACSASLVSDRPKKGPHRAHVAIQTMAATVTHSVGLVKGRRSRVGEERLVGRLGRGEAHRQPGVEHDQARHDRPQRRADLLRGCIARQDALCAALCPLPVGVQFARNQREHRRRVNARLRPVDGQRIRRWVPARVPDNYVRLGKREVVFQAGCAADLPDDNAVRGLGQQQRQPGPRQWIVGHDQDA